MSLARTALRLPAAARAPLARRFNATIATQGKGNAQTQEFLDAHKMSDPRIPSGTKAYFWPAPEPKDLPETDFMKRRQAVYAHAAGTTDLWRKISFYICVPAVIVCAVYVYQLEKEHEAHLQHQIDENGGVPPERKVYSYMNIRTKQFPWGNQSLFHNPRYNIAAEEA